MPALLSDNPKQPSKKTTASVPVPVPVVPLPVPLPLPLPVTVPVPSVPLPDPSDPSVRRRRPPTRYKHLDFEPKIRWYRPGADKRRKTGLSVDPLVPATAAPDQLILTDPHWLDILTCPDMPLPERRLCLQYGRRFATDNFVKEGYTGCKSMIRLIREVGIPDSFIFWCRSEWTNHRQMKDSVSAVSQPPYGCDHVRCNLPGPRKCGSMQRTNTDEKTRVHPRLPLMKTMRVKIWN